MEKVIRLTESELTKLVRTVIKESENEVFVAEMNADLAEVGLPRISLDDLNSDSIPQAFIDSSMNSDPKPNEGNDEKETIFQKIQNAICSSDEDQLKIAKKQIKNIIKKKFGIGRAIKNIFGGKKKSEQEPMNEQVELAVATTVLGVTAPLWVWVAIGAVVLFLILKRIFRRRDGYGCGGRLTLRQWQRKTGIY